MMRFFFCVHLITKSVCLDTNTIGALEIPVIATESSRVQIPFYIESELKDCFSKSVLSSCIIDCKGRRGCSCTVDILINETVCIVKQCTL